MLDFEDFEKLSARAKVEFMRANTAGKNTPMWFERLETAWLTESPSALMPWDWLLKEYWKMMEHKQEEL